MTQTPFTVYLQRLRHETDGSPDLLAKARLGNGAAFADLVGPYTSGLCRRARRLTGNLADAEDVTQEALIKAWMRLDQFSGSQDRNAGDFGAWLSRITTNTAFDHLRRRRPWVSLNEQKGPSAQAIESTIPAAANNPEKLTVRREQRRQLADAICQLPAGLRQICLLRDVLHYPTQEVAEQLGISAVAVRLRLFRARRLLRNKLETTLRPNRTPHGSEIGIRRTARRFVPLSAATNCACGD